jgi:predicted nuclease with TOPRIM domain
MALLSGSVRKKPIRYGGGIIATMTTINNIADLVRILKEQPEWADTIRGILLTEELLNLPNRFAEFVQLTQESYRLINERLTQIDTRIDRLETGQTETNRRLESVEAAQAENNQRLGRLETAQVETNQRLGRLETAQVETNQRLGRLETAQADTNRQLTQLNTRMDRLEGRFSNLEGSDYERKVRYGALHRAQVRFGLDNAYLALTQNDPAAPQLNSMIANAIKNAFISQEQCEDLYETDIIISDQGNRHVVVEVSLTADRDDIVRVKRRADVLSAVTGGAVIPVVITANLNDAQRDQAAVEEVTTFIMAYP